MTPIGFVRSEFPEKFGVPKQSGLAPALRAQLIFTGEWAHETCWKGIEDCSHLWVIFMFHQNPPLNGGTVRPPILGGDVRMGVFATRSPHRPNPVGLSLVERGRVRFNKGEAQIEVFGHDFVDGTPILDVKPYVATYDVPTKTPRHWSDELRQQDFPIRWEAGENVHREAIEQVLSLDPRPRSGKPGMKYGMSFAGFNVGFREVDGVIVVEEVSLQKTSPKVK